MKCLHSLERCKRGFESYLGHGCLVCMCVYCVCAFLCLGRGLETSWSLVQGVLPIVNRSGNRKEARAHKSCRAIKNIISWSSSIFSCLYLPVTTSSTVQILSSVSCFQTPLISVLLLRQRSSYETSGIRVMCIYSFVSGEETVRYIIRMNNTI
jgi:hypothetical protein